MPFQLLHRLFIVVTLFFPSAGYGQALVVSPATLSFQALEGGSPPPSQTLNVTLAAGWAASSNTNWITLTPNLGPGNGTITVDVTSGTNLHGTLYGSITLTPTAGQAVIVPVTFTVFPPQPPIPLSANEEWKKVCVDKSLNLNGDFQHGAFGYGAGNWSVGPSISTQLVKYDLAKKQAGFNTSVGAGASFRYYKDIEIRDSNGRTVDTVTVSQVKSECRQTSYGARKSYLAAPFISITPTLYVTKPTNEGDLSVQPALLVGFFEDILNFGVGWNLTGPPGEKGNVFLLMSIGYGFSF